MPVPVGNRITFYHNSSKFLKMTKELDTSSIYLPTHKFDLVGALQVACSLLMVGEKLDNHIVVKDILIEMGIYFQVQVSDCST